MRGTRPRCTGRRSVLRRTRHRLDRRHDQRQAIVVVKRPRRVIRGGECGEHRRAVAAHPRLRVQVVHRDEVRTTVVETQRASDRSLLPSACTSGRPARSTSRAAAQFSTRAAQWQEARCPWRPERGLKCLNRPSIPAGQGEAAATLPTHRRRNNHNVLIQSGVSTLFSSSGPRSRGRTTHCPRAPCRSPTRRRGRRPTPCPAWRSNTYRSRRPARGPVGQTRLVGGDLVGRHHFDAEMVEPALGVGVLEEHELQRRIGDGEVGVAGLALVRFGGEQLRVEGDGVVDVGNVQGELDS